MRAVGDAFIASNVVITGDVVLSPGVNIWYGTVIRGDIARITLGENVNIQDGSIVHTDFDVPLTIEAGVVAGHAVVIHCSRVGAGSLIGIGARLLNGCDIGEECLIAAGCVVAEGKKIPPRSVVMGIPGKIVREVTDDDLKRIRMISKRYREMAELYANGEMPFPYGRPTI